jgi:hypothetical protein
METQAMFVPAIGTLHNFVHIHDGDDNTEDLTAGDAPECEEARRLSDFIEEDPREIPPEELGWNIAAEETARSGAT